MGFGDGDGRVGRRRSRRIPRAAVRHRLPNRRALTGAVLVAASAAGVLVAHRAAAEPPHERYVVVAKEVAAGQVLRPGDLGTLPMDLPAGVAAVSDARADELVGRVARTELAALSLVRPGDLLDPGRFVDPGSVEVALELPPARALQGTLRVGDRVDVLSTDPEGTGTSTIARWARVSGVADEERDAIGAGGTVLVRLGLADADQAAAVVDASVRSEVSLVLPAPTGETRR